MNSIKNTLRFLFACLASGLVLAGCSKAKYKKTKGGMPYQLFQGKDTQQVRAGNFIKIQFTQKIKDSVYFTTVGTLPQYQQVSDQQQPYDVSELWTSLKLGDSVVSTQLIDTFMNRNPQNFPPQFKKGDKIITYIKILGIFTSDSAAREDYEKTNKAWLATEVTMIEKYLADKKITAQKTPSGAFVETLTPGTGNVVDSNKYVSVNYTGTNWSGVKIDSNVDSAFGHVGPYSFTTATNSMIKGFDEGVMMMRLGGRARVYIPSLLGYGGQPQPGSPIKPYDKLIFDIEIVDVKDKAPTPPARQEVPAVNMPQQK
ncbi:MAG TPA: FKBP-type peptidyl-prolyl cis-trans isomerase [Chitinophagaceae bacterium]|jgi:FKBP-type peptidyl-prolyl cis-trans isomerase|nr:FKBP-type peptidyl-prolyl cis-trans isomerase [Chitinophagaceae bacterium]